MKTKILLFFVIFLIPVFPFVRGQVNQQWVQTYNGPANSTDCPTDMRIDGNENICIVGYSVGTGTGNDIFIMKYSSSGALLWVQRYNGPANNDDRATAMYVDGNNNIFVTGFSVGSGSGYDIVTIKLDQDGVVQWVQRYNGSANGDDRGTGIFTSSTGNVFVAGTSPGSGSGLDYVIIRYNSQGVQQFAVRYNDQLNLDDVAIGIVSDNVNSLFVSGTAGSLQSNDIVTIRYDYSGNQVWLNSYNGVGNGSDGANAVATDNFNVYVTGYSAGIGTGLDYITLKYTLAGALSWSARQNGLGNQNDEGKAITVDNSGNVLVTGITAGNGTGFDMGTFKYNMAGVLQWSQRYNLQNTTNENGCSIAVDQLGGVFVTGTSFINGPDYITIKYSSTGVQQWITNYNGTGGGNDSAKIVKQFSGNVYVTGEAFGIGTGFDVATVKYTQPTAIRKIEGNVPDMFVLYQNYPNPFNPSTKIKFDIPAIGNNLEQNVKLVLFDALGRELAVILDENLNPGSYEIELNSGMYSLSMQSSGVYFFKLISGNYIDTKKLVLLK